MIKNLQDWQHRLRTGPAIWIVEDEEGQVSSLYESQEAAEYELTWRRTRNHQGFTARRVEIHTLELAQERWEEIPIPPMKPQQ